ncbi:tetratricopeptide repeat protein [Bradyrhizobium sp. 40]|uniref:tetratricopeptide repeat protein n=1 Tax=Bradyrhizobium sp. 40 TaxID=2782674 RepID=UPI0020004917|nr:tetratricopeptide repeat protein [Bradyrhizobium sp. 40]UPJ41953.1 tetratricopeptide repeat protein [Bradyrhizobium sp. 40]
MQITKPSTAVPACTRMLNSKNIKRNVVLNNLGAALNNDGKYDRALEVLTQSIRLDSSYAFAWQNRGLAWYRLGDIDKSLSDLEMSLKLNPGNAAAYNTRGMVKLDTGDIEGCLTDFDRLVELAPKEPVAYNNRGICRRSRREYDKAVNDFEQAIHLKPTYDVPWSNRGETFRLKGDLDRALQDQSKAIEINPKNGTNFTLRGDTYRYLGSIELALADYDKALAVKPEAPIPALTGRGLTLERKGDFAGAKAAFEQAMAARSIDKSEINRSALETAKARLAALDSGAPQPSIEPVPTKIKTTTSIPTSDAKVPSVALGNLRADRRVALVIGNSSYRAVSPLTNPRNDAGAIAKSLRNIGFQAVTLVTDATRESIIDALRAFANEAENSDWAMVYYAGHGIEVGGVNYLIPVDAKLAVDRDIEYEAIPMSQVLRAANAAKKIKLVMLDACRDNPFTPRKTDTPALMVGSESTAGRAIASRSTSGRGLAEVKVQGATLVVFAAKDGQVALDGEGGNSPFAVAVTQRIATPGVEINKMFRLIRDDVMEATAGRQEPYTYGSLPGKEDFFFVSK